MNNEELANYTIFPTSSIFDALQLVNQNEHQVAVMINEEKRILGVITDGDIRRALLKGISLDSSVLKVVNQNPLTASKGESPKRLISKMQDRSVFFVPILDDDNRLIDLIFLSDLLNLNRKNNSVIIMAGGKGTRLGDLTINCPKPMLRIGNKPILEIIINHISSFGFNDFHVSVNYLREQITQHFENGEKMGLKISYLYENKPLGTAGALANFNPINKEPIIVMNGDIYTDLDFSSLIDFHKSQNSLATVCLRKFDYQIPYGVVSTNEKLITVIEEKPIHSYFVNAGIYVFEPEILSMIPRDTYYPMTKLLNCLVQNKKQVFTHEIEGLWMDIGRQEDFKQASCIASTEIP